MTTTLITRSWLAFAAVGAGIIHLALVIGSPLVFGALLLALGLAEIAWGVAILVKDRMVVPRVAQAGAIAPLMLWALLVVAATLLGTPAVAAPLRFLPMAIAAVFEIFIGAVLSVKFRRLAQPDRQASTRAPASAVRYLSAVLAAGILVGALTTPALAATQAGTVALEHGGTMGGMMDMPGMGHH
ncbi:hypothetical protein [Lacisediminihabitans sp.]|uniref:hypothetical protein n=1 Tax=Lacisediminihabitans sp. TaxID=2787631 RepID=UPI00374DD8A5